MVSKEEIKELKKIKNENNLPKNEEKTVPIVKNNEQYKVSLPKKFTDLINMENRKAKVIYNKKEGRIYLEI